MVITWMLSSRVEIAGHGTCAVEAAITKSVELGDLDATTFAGGSIFAYVRTPNFRQTVPSTFLLSKKE